MKVKITDKELNNYELEPFSEECSNNCINFSDIKSVIDEYMTDDICYGSYKYGEIYHAIEYYERELKIARIKLDRVTKLLNKFSRILKIKYHKQLDEI